MKLLVTGFEPFGNLEMNPSAEAADELVARNTYMHKAILPTSYRRSAATLEESLKDGTVTALLMLGYASNVDGLRLEKFGSNSVTSGSPDNDGVVLSGNIDPLGPGRLATYVNLESCIAAAEENCRAYISEDAGGYVCNYAYYCALRKFPNVRTIFIHITAAKDTEEFSKAVLALDGIAKILLD